MSQRIPSVKSVRSNSAMEDQACLISVEAQGRDSCKRQLSYRKVSFSRK